jgi:hypothetical protein
MDRGIALYQGLKTPPVFWPLLLSVRARGLALGGRPDEGLALLDDALGMVEAGNFLYPELVILKGDLLIAVDDAASAEPLFQAALDAARTLDARTPQLQAATRLTRLRPAGTGILRDVYETFTEGLDAAPLVEARAALDEADARVG